MLTRDNEDYNRMDTVEQLGKISFFWSMAPNLLGTNVILITCWMSSNH